MPGRVLPPDFVVLASKSYCYIGWFEFHKDAGGSQRTGMTFLVTGATGFIGSAVVRSLRKRDASIRVLARKSSDHRNLDGLDVELVEGDLMDRPSLDAALRGCEGLFHVAADYRLWARNPGAVIDTNVIGTRNVMKAAGEAGVSRIVYTSTVATLGLHSDGHPTDENTSARAEELIGPYKRSKFQAEEDVRKLVTEDGLAVVIVNPSTPVGPRDIKPTPTGRMIVEAASGQMPAYVDTGLNLVHVDDVADGHLAAFDKGEVGERYILGGENWSLQKILSEIANIVGRPPPRFKIAPGLVLPLAYLAQGWTRVMGGEEPLVTVDGVRMARKRMFFTCEKAKSALGYQPRPVINALVDAVDWFRAEGYLR